MTTGDPWDSTEKNEDISFCDLARATKDLMATQESIMAMVDEVADAKTIKEMHGERAKQALSQAIVRCGAESVAKGEVMARCDSKYLGQIDNLQDELRKAERSLGRFAALHAKLDGLRTLISCQKVTMQM